MGEKVLKATVIILPNIAYRICRVRVSHNKGNVKSYLGCN